MVLLDPELAMRFSAALGLGALLGLERERTHIGEKTFAGVRTFVLFSMLGALVGLPDFEKDIPWLPLVALGCLTALVGIQYAVSAGKGEIGLTSELTALLTFMLGLLCIKGLVPLAAALGVTLTLVLALKQWLHGLARKIQSADVEATLKFAIISLIILPLVPNHNFGPPGLEVINPYKIWLMVVLISGLNFASYILVKVVGKEHGLGITGLLGGLVSSTAVTLGFSQRSKEQPEQASPLALGILLAWTIMFFRVIIMVGIISRPLGLRLLLGMGIMGVECLAICFLLWRGQKTTEKGSVSAGENPFELSQAVKFGLLYGVITFGAKAAQVYLGGAGLYIAGALAGLTDVDAISLSMANMAQQDPANIDAAARAVIIAALSNTVVKAGMAVSMGSIPLRKRMLPFSILIVVTGASVAFFLL